MVTFENGLDYRVREAKTPTVARFNMGNGEYRFIVIGTDYGHICTTAGDIRTWRSYSGARRFARSYAEYRKDYYV